MRNRGFSLLELLLVMVVFLLMSAAALDLLWKGQATYQEQTEMARSTQQIRIAMDQIVRYLRQAGNDPFGALAANNLDSVAVLQPTSTEGNNGLKIQLAINSDVTGSIPSATEDPKESTGDPDGAFDAIHEQVVIQLINSTLSIDIGYGPETLAEEIADLNLTFYDKWGNPVGNPDSALRANVELVSDKNVTLSTDVLLKRSSYSSLYQ